ncbi:MAG TPA: DUF1501 domain-containing protein [Candidatus Limnocylindria bacterium]|nr:DUF1501 domain-containing protein [Candidatus Limnocylindria bacterium]
MKSSSILNRRSFLGSASSLGILAALGTLTDIPLVVQRALAEGTIGQPGPNGRVKKLLFVFLRGANDGLNAVVPYGDPSYNTTIRPSLYLPTDPANPPTATGPALFPEQGAAGATYGYAYGLPLGNGFAGLHPSLKFLAPIFNAKQLALVHRVAYPKQSRSHFDSQAYWETGVPGNNLVRDGILYRAMVQSGLSHTSPLTGVSFQSSLPLILRGSGAAMTNLSDPTRYGLLGVPNTTVSNAKFRSMIKGLDQQSFPDRQNREMLSLQYQNLEDTMELFSSLDFSETGNTFVDNLATDGDQPYYLFPTANAKNGGYATNQKATKYVVPTSSYGFFKQLKSAAIVLNKTDAIVAGTQIDGWDTHGNQVDDVDTAAGKGPHTGTHANLLRQVGWSLYALQKYFQNYSDKCRWEDVVIVTLSEFGRTTIENSNNGTDHAEASAMFIGGGSVRGGVYNCGPSDPIPWVTGPNGTLFRATGRYLQRATDYRSVLGELIRDHLGATPQQLGKIIPGYADPDQKLEHGGIQPQDKVPVTGELNLV